MPAASEWMTRYCDGDAAAFRALYAELSPGLFAHLARACPQPGLAAAIVQRTFEAVHRARGAYVRGAAPEPWIYAIADRLAAHARATPAPR